jgi:hypothetical protein
MRLDDYRAELRQCLIDADVPKTLREGLIEYFAVRRPTGSFLRAVLENNLRDAALRADPVNRFCLGELALVLYHCCPAAAWGSPWAVGAWLAATEPVDLRSPPPFTEGD